MFLFYQEKLLKRQIENNFFWHWYEQQEELGMGIGWEESFYQGLKEEIWQEKNKNLKKVISSNLKPKKYIFEEEACLQRQYAEKQKRNVERKQHQEQKQCYTEKQKQFPYEKKEQQEIKIQNQKWKKEVQSESEQRDRKSVV